MILVALLASTVFLLMLGWGLGWWMRGETGHDLAERAGYEAGYGDALRAAAWLSYEDARRGR